LLALLALLPPLLPPLLAVLLTGLRFGLSTGPRHPLARDAPKQRMEVNGVVQFAPFFDCHGYLLASDAA
jgi:hypothetical protein